MRAWLVMLLLSGWVGIGSGQSLADLAKKNREAGDQKKSRLVITDRDLKKTDNSPGVLHAYPEGHKVGHLIAAIYKGDIDRIQQLLDAGVDVNGYIEEARSPVINWSNATAYGNTGNRYAGVTPLLAATPYGSLSMIKLLLDHGADVNARIPYDVNYYSESPLVRAVMWGRSKVIEAMLACSVTPDNFRDAVVCAAKEGKLEQLKLLLNLSVDPEAVRQALAVAQWPEITDVLKRAQQGERSF